MQRALRENPVARIVISVPHTGTRFLFTLLNCHHRHTYESWKLLDSEIGGRVIVAPLRDPRKVWRSWVNGVQPSSKNIGDTVMRLDNFENCWDRLAELDERYDVHYVPIDTPSRDLEVRRLAGVLDQDIRPDWNDNPWHHTPTEENLEWQKSTVFPKVDWAKIYAMPMIERFYA